MSIKVVNITKKYQDQLAVDGASFEISKGQIVGFLGPNGAGKSTTMKMLTGYVSPTEGELWICDKKVDTAVNTTNQFIGYLPEHNPLYKELYVKEYLTFIASIHKVSRSAVADVLEKTGLTGEMHKKIMHLSKGYQQRVGLAAAIIHNPAVLILDEPTTGLDPNQLVEIRSLIKTLGKDKTVIFSTHILQEVEAVCDRVIIINKGKIVLDSTLEALKKGENQVVFVEFDYQIETQLLRNVKDILKCENVNENIWKLIFKVKEDRRSAIFDFAQQNGLKILQLRTENKTLESLFKEYTQ